MLSLLFLSLSLKTHTHSYKSNHHVRTFDQKQGEEAPCKKLESLPESKFLEDSVSLLLAHLRLSTILHLWLDLRSITRYAGGGWRCRAMRDVPRPLGRGGSQSCNHSATSKLIRTWFLSTAVSKSPPPFQKVLTVPQSLQATTYHLLLSGSKKPLKSMDVQASITTAGSEHALKGSQNLLDFPLDSQVPSFTQLRHSALTKQLLPPHELLERTGL